MLQIITQNTTIVWIYDNSKNMQIFLMNCISWIYWTVHRLAVHSSIAGDREKAWGKTKVFREGQSAQTLDDLFFEFIDVAERLQPKVIGCRKRQGNSTGKCKGICKRNHKTIIDNRL